MKEGYISIREILDNLLEHPLLKDLPFDRAVNYTVHFLRLIGMPRMFEEKCASVDIANYRGFLPCDFYDMIQVRTFSNYMSGGYEVFRYSTDSFHMSDNKQDSTDLTYKLQGNVIFTSMKDGIIEVAYHAIVTDEDGYPMIPDNSAFIRALELFIKKQHFTVLFDLGKISPTVYQNVKQEYAWAVGAAQSDMVKLSVDQMQSLTNSLNTLIVRASEHKRGFVNNGTQEKLKVK